jgi:hypothetical protein
MFAGLPQKDGALRCLTDIRLTPVSPTRQSNRGEALKFKGNMCQAEKGLKNDSDEKSKGRGIIRPDHAYRTRVECFIVRQVKPKNGYIEVFLLDIKKPV